MPTKWISGLYPLNANADYSKIIQNNQNQNIQEILDDKAKIVLNFMRENLDKNIIDEFKRNKNDKWQGSIEYKKLFEFWKWCEKKQFTTESQIEVRIKVFN